MNTLKITAAAALAATLSLSVSPAPAGGSHSGGHGHGNAPDIGKPGSATHVDRIVHASMGEMFFTPDSLEVTKGETIRLVIRNEGDLVHEFNIGTSEMHMAHAEEMNAMMDRGILEIDRLNHHMMNADDMAHDDPNSVLLEPGGTGEIIWTFDGAARIEFSCNVPGHRESGMMGPIRLRERQP